MKCKNRILRFSLLVCLSGLTGMAFPQYESFRNSFNLLTTIAGKGDMDNGGENGWLVNYEGAPATQAELSRPHMAMADLAGNIYIADKDAHAIRKVDTDGIITTVAGTSTAGDGGDGVATEQALNAPNGLWVNKAGAFYILDLNNNKIRKVDTEGTMSTVVDDAAGISLGRGLWISQSEDTIWYSSGSQIKMWTAGSGITAYATGFSGLGNIVQDPNGYIVATDRTASRVYRIDRDGNKVVIAGNGSSLGGGEGSPALEKAFHGVRGVWFLEDASYFLALHEGSQIWYIDTDNLAYLFLDGNEGDEYHSGDGENYQSPGYKMSEARAVTVDYAGNVLVTENDRGFIRRIEKADADAILHGFESHFSWTLYPNPSLDELNLRINLPNPGEVQITITDIQGQILQRLELENQPAGLREIKGYTPHLPPGIYFISIRSGNVLLSRKWRIIAYPGP